MVQLRFLFQLDLPYTKAEECRFVERRSGGERRSGARDGHERRIAPAR